MYSTHTKPTGTYAIFSQYPVKVPEMKKQPTGEINHSLKIIFTI